MTYSAAEYKRHSSFPIAKDRQSELDWHLAEQALKFARLPSPL